MNALLSPSRRTFLLLLSALLLLTNFFACSCANGQDVFRYPEGRYGNGELRYINEVPVLIVRGSRREIGEQIGNLALKPAARVVDLARAYPLKSIALSELFDRTRGSP